jgi:hypothetical protein
MNSTIDIHRVQPEVGQQFTDASGRRWSVEDVQPLGTHGAANPFFVLRMTFKSPDARGATFRMSSQEFQTLAAGGGFRPARH